MDKKKEVAAMAKCIGNEILQHASRATTVQEMGAALVNAGYGNIQQAVIEFSEKLEEVYCNLDYLPSGDEFCEIIKELIKKLYGEE